MGSWSDDAPDHTPTIGALYTEIASRHGLRFEFELDQPIEICFRIPSQPALSFEITLMLQNNDELHIAVPPFWLSWFPCDDGQVRAAFVEALEGLITGDYRIVVRRARFGWQKCWLQKRVGRDWQDRGSSGSGIWPRLGPITSETIICNELGPERPRPGLDEAGP